MANPPRPRIGFGASSPEAPPALPFRLLVVADFSPAGAESALSPIPVDKESFTEVLRRVCPRVSFQLEQPGPKPEFVAVEIPVKDLKSFQPAAVRQALDWLRESREARAAVVELRDGKLSREQFSKRMESARLPFLSPAALAALTRAPEPARPSPAAPAPARSRSDSDDALDSILDLVEAPPGARGAEATEGAARVDDLVAKMFGRTGGPGPIDRRAADGLIGEIDRYLSAQLDRVMRHPEFRRIEAAWRGLKFLIDRVDFREPIRLEIIPAGREKLAQVIETLVEEPAPDAPVAAVVTDFEFGASGPEMELLRGAAEAAAQLQAPLLASVGPSFFGKASAGEVARISNLRAHLEAPEYVKWRGLAEAEASRWVGLAFNRFLLRSGSDESGARGEGLWGNPAWAVGALLARSFAATGWAGHITGVRGGGAIEDLPLAEHLLPSGDTTQIPLETIFLKDRQYDFFEAGFMVLQCGENQDAAILLQSPTAHRPEKYSDARETEISRWRATLTYQMVASRFVQHLAPLLSSLVTSGSPSEIQAWIERGLRRLANLDALEVRIQESKERPGFWDLHLRIRPGPAIWTLPVDIELELPIRRQ